ncbi:MAG: hypothetical protein MUC96_11560 [Myxococcaceae bacterium]|nr:hypothetical protein [Myxococcaceae bacterium]
MRWVLLAGLVVGCAGAQGPEPRPDEPERPVPAIDAGVVTQVRNPFIATRCLEALAPRVQFPQAVAGCSSSSATLGVRNRCDFAVKVTGAGPATSFGLTQSLDSLEPGAEGVLTLRFVPRQAGRYFERIVVNARVGPHAQALTVELEANASSPRRVSADLAIPVPEVRFSRLFIVDDEGAVERRPQVDAMAQYLRASYSEEPFGADVVVSDLTGALQTPDGVSVLRTSDPAFRRRFVAAMEPAPKPGLRSCFETAVRLREERRPAGFWDRTWPPDIVCITMSPDESSASGAAMVAAFQRGMGLPQLSFTLMAPYPVLPPFGAPACRGEVDARLDSLAVATSGMRDSLCAPGWATALENIGRGHPPPVRVWLPGPVVSDASSLRVEINDRDLPAIDARGARSWRYQSTPPAIAFEPLHTPMPTDRLRLSWDTCEP